MSLPLKIFFPGQLVFGNNTFPALADEIIRRSPAHVLICSITPLDAITNKLKERLEEAGIRVQTDTSIVAEPSFSDFHTLMESVSGFDPDVVVGIGGGSVLDVAKLVAAQLGNPQRLEEYVGIGLLGQRSRLLICVPTTSGTGSEVSPNAILVDDADGQKKGIISPFLVPDIVYVDPVLTHSLPPAITAATGIDALTHCLEAYTNKHAIPFIDNFALEGMRRISAHIIDAVQDGSNAEAREQVALGSLYGGFCLGPVNTAGVHALSYPLGSLYHLSHGLSNALLLPWVMEYNIPASVSRHAEVALALGCSHGHDDMETAMAGVERIRTINRACGIPSRLSEVGVTEDSLQGMARDAMKVQRLLKNNPREITESDALHIFKQAL
jgi:alcohol dehydrogenase class IV